MKSETKTTLKNVFLLTSTVVTVNAFLRAVDEDAGAGILIVLLWGIGPYILFLVLTLLLERFSSMRQGPGIGFGISIFILLYALGVYLEPLNHKSSTEGLIFMFAPLWLYFFIPPVFGICTLLAWLTNRQSEKRLGDS